MLTSLFCYGAINDLLDYSRKALDDSDWRMADRYKEPVWKIYA
jgi:hypothetical protein